MRQFDVCRNLGAGRLETPYLVIVQSAEFASFRRRLVVPLTRAAGQPQSYAPTIVIDGVTLTADALQLFSIPLSRLGAVVASLAADGTAALLINAIDRVISRAYG